jgi:hypothetical protein
MLKRSPGAGAFAGLVFLKRKFGVDFGLILRNQPCVFLQSDGGYFGPGETV